MSHQTTTGLLRILGNGVVWNSLSEKIDEALYSVVGETPETTTFDEAYNKAEKLIESAAAGG